MSGFIYGRNPNADTLDGLDSTAFAILAGRAGGQTLQGGTAANETLTLVSTAHGTKGGITLTGSHVILPGSIRPAADSTTALTLCKANGDAVVTVDTTNGRIGIGAGVALINTLSIKDVDAVNSIIVSDTTYDLVKIGTAGLAGAGYIGLLKNGVQTIQLTADASYPSYVPGFFGIGTDAPATRLDIAGGAMQFLEMTAPGAGAANTARIYAEDNGAGKTRLMVQFATGAAQQISIEP